MPFHIVRHPVFANRNNRGSSALFKKKDRYFSYSRGPGSRSARIHREYLFLKRFLLSFSQLMVISARNRAVLNTTEAAAEGGLRGIKTARRFAN